MDKDVRKMVPKMHVNCSKMALESRKRGILMIIVSSFWESK
ncbi:hypothetical protein [Butyrivibrio sp. WCD3002]|nr:hypothetical protein [Butyrivibrio sp. WCD3002]